MSTRSAIARIEDEPGHFTGSYHHWDGYPTGLGAWLYQAYKGQFNSNLDAMLKALVDDHTGWSTLQVEPGKEPECFCHSRGEGFDEKNRVTQVDASGMGCEYVYAFSEATKEMLVLSSYHANGSKAIGMFGFGDENAEWRCIGTVKLDAEEAPDFGKMEEEEA